MQNETEQRKESAKTTTTIVVRKTTTGNRKIRSISNTSISRDRSELQRLFRYNRCKAIHINGEDEETSLPERK